LIEFTMSRAAVMACGVILLATVAGVLGGIYDNDADRMDGELADRLAHMLDIFCSSGIDEMIIDGSMVLPEGYTMNVHDGFVEVLREDRIHVASTEYKGSFIMHWNEVRTIVRRRSRLSS